jgi:hypothetical protein
MTEIEDEPNNSDAPDRENGRRSCRRFGNSPGG